MRSTGRAVWAGVTGLVLTAAAGARTASAQLPAGGEIRSLGGYGGAMTDTGSGAGMGGPAIPYAGKFGGFMPYRMGGSGGLSFQTRAAPPMGSGRTPFTLSPASSGMSSMSGGLGTSAPFGTRSPGGGMQPMSGPRGMGVMPPNFGYPFRQPPSLLSPASAGAGMSM